MDTSSQLRFKDVLIALAAADEVNKPLRRIQLQKFVYLMDVFSLVWRRISRPASFEPEKNGPYDREIQNAVDALAFRGFVKVVKIKIINSTRVHAAYRLSDVGRRMIEKIIKVPDVAEQYQLAMEVAKEIDVPDRGWNNIKKIVYSEPTYLTAKLGRNRQRLRLNDPEENLSIHLAFLFEQGWLPTAETPITAEVYIQALFLVFDEIRLSGLTA